MKESFIGTERFRATASSKRPRAKLKQFGPTLRGCLFRPPTTVFSSAKTNIIRVGRNEEFKRERGHQNEKR